MIPTLEDLERLAKAATPGEWLNAYPNACKLTPMPDHVWTSEKELIAKDLILEDAAFIASASPQTILKLCGMLRSAREMATYKLGCDCGACVEKARAFLKEMEGA